MLVSVFLFSPVVCGREAHKTEVVIDSGFQRHRRIPLYISLVSLIRGPFALRFRLSGLEIAGDRGRERRQGGGGSDRREHLGLVCAALLFCSTSGR